MSQSTLEIQVVVRSYAARVFSAVGCICTLMVIPTSAGPLSNGSFEGPIVPAGFYSVFAGASIALPGWTVAGDNVAIVSGTYLESGITFQAQSGNQWLDLSGLNSNSTTNGVTQDVMTEIGRAYELSYYVGSATDGRLFFPSTIDLSINGGPRASFTNATAPTSMLDWRRFDVQFVATSAVTNLSFFFGGSANNHIGALDNVSLTLVPEPSSVSIVTVGGCLIGIRGTRRLGPSRRTDNRG